MRDSRPSPGPDRLLGAKQRGTAEHHAKWRDLTGEETETAVAELRELAAGRADLLAEQLGLLIGFYADHINGPLKRCAAGLLIAAGADKAESASTTALYTCVSSDFRTRTLRRALDQTVAAALPGTGSTR